MRGRWILLIGLLIALIPPYLVYSGQVSSYEKAVDLCNVSYKEITTIAKGSQWWNGREDAYGVRVGYAGFLTDTKYSLAPVEVVVYSSIFKAYAWSNAFNVFYELHEESFLLGSVLVNVMSVTETEIVLQLEYPHYEYPEYHGELATFSTLFFSSLIGFGIAVCLDSEVQSSPTSARDAE